MNADLTVFLIDFHDSRESLRVELNLDMTINIHHVPAVSAATDARWDPNSASNTLGPGGAGCMLAHLDAISIIANAPFPEENQFSLVLESDAVITDFGRRWLPDVSQLGQTAAVNFLQVGANRTSLNRSNRRVLSMDFLTDVLETTALTRVKPILTQALTSAGHAYLIRPDFARTVLNLDLGFQIPIDNWFRVLALDPRNKMFRTRQDIFSVSGRSSSVDPLGR